MDALTSKVGQEIKLSEWQAVDQAAVNLFADATGDHQWIHIDVERAKAESPFGGPIAHGFMSLSMMPMLMGDTFEGLPIAQMVNYGCEKVRFPSPLPVGARVRGRFILDDVSEGPMGSFKCTISGKVEVEGSDKPACVATFIFLIFPKTAEA